MPKKKKKTNEKVFSSILFINIIVKTKNRVHLSHVVGTNNIITFPDTFQFIIILSLNRRSCKIFIP